MMRPSTSWFVGFSLLTILSVALGAEQKTAAPGPEKYTLRYRFQPDETLRWEVVHRALIKTTVSGTTQTTETVTKSIKAWRVTEVKQDGTAVFENMVESVDMRQKLTGRQEVHYNSQTDKKPPPGFEMVAESVGVKLATITLSPTGKVIHRKQEKVAAAAQNEDGEITIPFPQKPVAVGESWSFPHNIVIPLNNGAIKNVKTQQKFTLASVKTGVATIRVATVVLTPIHDPAVEAQLIQRLSAGTVRFDVDAGRIIAQQMDLDKRVVGFTGNSPDSSLHYLTRFTEDFLPAKRKSSEAKKTETPEAKTAQAASSDDKKTKTADVAKPDDKESKTAESSSPEDKKTKTADVAKPRDKETKTADAAKADNEETKTADAAEPDDSETKMVENEKEDDADTEPSVASKPTETSTK